MKKKKQEHMAYPFFSYGEGSDRKFAIPGSSIRGELRSVFEAATDSCMSTLRPDTKLSRRVDCRYPIWAGIAEQVSKIDGKDSRVSKKATGYVYVGEMFAMKKHGESIFQCKEEVKNIGTEELEHAFRDMLETLEIYQDTGINKTKGHIYKMTEKNQFNSTMELVMSETEKPLFEFTVYYDGITKKQLDRLIWCINFGDNTKEGKMAHKIGHGKPLGLGSVKFLVTEHRERIFTNDQYNGKMDSLLCIGQRINVTFKEQRDGHVNFYLAD